MDRCDRMRVLDAGEEVLASHRESRRDAWRNGLQPRVFHALVRSFSRGDFNEMMCGLRGPTRETAQEFDLYHDLHLVSPGLVALCGYRVVGIPVAQGRKSRTPRLCAPGILDPGLLDLGVQVTSSARVNAG